MAFAFGDVYVAAGAEVTYGYDFGLRACRTM